MTDMMQMVVRMVSPLLNEMAESSQAYMTTEGDDCSAPPANNEMMSFPMAMRMTCRDVSEFIWNVIWAEYDSLELLPRVLLALMFACVLHWGWWAWIASAWCAGLVTCSSNPAAGSACWWTCKVSWFHIWKAWWEICRLMQLVQGQHYFENREAIVFYVKAWNARDVKILSQRI